VFLSAWHQQVGQTFELGNTTVFRPSLRAYPGQIDNLDLLGQEITEAHFRGFSVYSRWLFIIECSDAANGIHQLQILRGPGDRGSVQWKMSHALGDSFGGANTCSGTALVEIAKGINSESESWRLRLVAQPTTCATTRSTQDQLLCPHL